MAGFVPTEGKTLLATLIHKRTYHVDRDSGLEVGLFTNAAADATLTEATVTEPTGTGYARITLTDSNWSIAGAVSSYAKQTFTGGAGGWTGSVYGYFVATKAAGGTQRLLYVEIDPAGPFTIGEGDTYDVTAHNTIS
jgi:hypothetical protein